MNYKFKTKPYAHQLRALEMSWDKKCFAYFMEMGTGKSKVLIDNTAILYDNGKINGVLIVAPKGVYKNWYSSEIPTHLPDHIEKNMVLWQANITKQQQKYLDSLFKTGTDLHILIMNVESLSTKKGVDFAARFLNSHRTMMAIDESTTIKNPEAKRTKNICQLGLATKYNRILTGSPVTKSPLDLYKQCDFLTPELLGHSSYYSFRTRYAVMRTANFGGRSVQIVVGYRNLEELSEKLKEFSYRVLKDRGEGLGAPVNIYDSSSDIMSKTTPDANYKDRLPNGNYIDKTASHFVIITGDNPATALISMKSTQLKISRKWNSMMSGIKMKGANGLFTPASFSHIYRLKTTQMSNDKGTWFGWEVSKVGPVTDQSLYGQAKSFSENISKGSVKAKHGETEAKKDSII